MIILERDYFSILVCKSLDDVQYSGVVLVRLMTILTIPKCISFPSTSWWYSKNFYMCLCSSVCSVPLQWPKFISMWFIYSGVLMSLRDFSILVFYFSHSWWYRVLNDQKDDWIELLLALTWAVRLIQRRHIGWGWKFKALYSPTLYMVMYHIQGGRKWSLAPFILKVIALRKNY